VKLSVVFSIFAAFLLLALLSAGDTEYYRHIVFDNSLTSDNYFYSHAEASPPSSIEQKDGRLPVETRWFIRPSNALRLQCQSGESGGWEAEVRVVNFRYRFPELSGRNLYLWCYTPRSIAADDLPRIMLSTTREGLQVAEFPGSFSDLPPLGKFAGDMPAGRSVQVRIPLSAFRTGSIYKFRPSFVQNVLFLQGRSDGVPHTLILDEIRFDDDIDGVAGRPQ
jgi:exo beta-1,2-glucooligosaccharide sophorohydrolase (non-reducing end)